MKDKQYQQYIIWRQQMQIMGEILADSGHDDIASDMGAAPAWSAQDPLAREDFNESLANRGLDHVSQSEMIQFELEYDASLI
ncbi:hypothetical protein AWM75_04525 [Aerococcus urinaehominis]|uniref:Uncharacterized protein n=1 Tax=Aerococcus urinaehominis TaxID=128944 RepID=A0A0X8FL99_9LACT|nr:hypothetical protein [Aerococcus urinaehominis]AMB99312.1 hypothetical protein AWM75_04525 [Aerococcus urinaehominis]SDM19875.1 hypothetical protein SAMN04487985_10833 [Aerococcus urinaehominis]